MIAIGAGGLDVAVAMGGGPFYLTYPRVIKVELTGALQPFVAAKDIILKVLEILTTKGNVGAIIEYGGPGISSLSVPERSTITNMGAELGVTTSVFPSDEITRQFLIAQDRESVYIPLSADSDATYDRIITINLNELEPMIACPHSPGNVKRVRDVAGTDVDQVLIGSCTNASFRDLSLVAALLKSKKAAPQLSLGVASGSRQVMEMIGRNGSLADIIASGARILESACGFCIGNSLAPRTDGVSVRTSNRNFYGRSGTPSANVYLASPETAVATALAGKIVDPRDFFKGNFPKLTIPNKFTIDDDLILEPSKSPASITIFRGPNIGDPPSNETCPDSIKGVVTIKVGDKITTDHIMPAGSRLKYRSNIPKYAEFVFEREDPTFASRAAENRKNGIHNIIIAGESYGQGSSREHAAICPMYLGVKMVIARTMERIHRANLINFGIIPADFVNAADYDKLAAGAAIEITNVRNAIAGSGDLILKTGVHSIALNVSLTDREKEMIHAGGLINATKLEGKV
jgi:aconitate hydratase